MWDSGILNNEIYISRLVWTRCSYVKNAKFARRVVRLSPPEEWEVVEAPNRGIVGDALWQKAEERQARVT